MEDWSIEQDLSLEAGLSQLDADWTDQLFLANEAPEVQGSGDGGGLSLVDAPALQALLDYPPPLETLDSTLCSGSDPTALFLATDVLGSGTSYEDPASRAASGTLTQLSGSGALFSMKDTLFQESYPAGRQQVGKLAEKSPVCERVEESGLTGVVVEQEYATSSEGKGQTTASWDAGKSRSGTGSETQNLDKDSDSDDGNRQRPEDPVKREERLARNRESAQLSRQRKKAYVDELELRLQALTTTVTELNTAMAHLRAENTALRQQLAIYCPKPTAAGLPYQPPVALPYPQAYMAANPPPLPIPRIPVHTTTSSKPRKRGSSANGSSKSKKSKALGTVGVAMLGIFCLAMVLVPGQDQGSSMVHTSGQVKLPGRALMAVSEGSEADPHHPFPLSLYNSSLGPEVTAGIHNSSTMTGGSTKLTGGRTEVTGASTEVTGGALPGLVALDAGAGLVNQESILRAVSTGAREVFGRNSKGRVVIAESSLQEQAQRMQAIATLAQGSALTVAALPQKGTISSPQDWEGGTSGSLLTSAMCTELFHFFEEGQVNHDVFEAAVYENVSTSASFADSNSTVNEQSLGRRFRLKNPYAVPLPPAGQKGRDQKPVREVKSERGAMVVSVLVPATDGSFERQVPPAEVKGRSLTQVFVVVLLNSAKYVTYSCTLPTLGHASPSGVNR